MREEDTDGVVALRGGRTVRYLLGSLRTPPQVTYRQVTVSYAGAAVDPALEDGREVYREMYAAVATQWIAAGCFAHYVCVAAQDRLAVDAWFSLDFGQDNTLAVRDTLPAIGMEAGSDIEIRRAGRRTSRRRCA